jgi:hypothetical protein
LRDGPALTALTKAFSIIGTNGTLFIKVGSEAQKLAKSQSADVVYIRGAVADVDRVSGEIKQIVERAQTDGIENEFVSRMTERSSSNDSHCPRLLSLKSAVITSDGWLALVVLVSTNCVTSSESK